MAENEAADSIATVWANIGSKIQLLAIAGVCGAFLKAILAPEGKWRRRAAQGLTGVFCAVFLGGFLAGMVEGFVSEPALALLASGFICGTAGETALAFVQRRILGGREK